MLLFSIIIPTYNRAAIIKNVIGHIIAQTYPHWELIIIDDGGTDSTGKVVMDFLDARIKYFKIENSERSAARNIGLKHATGKYINYFDSDDIMYPNRLQAVYEYLESNNEPDVVFTSYDVVDEKNKIIGHMERHFSSFTKDLLFNNFLAVNSVFLKRIVALNFSFHEDRRIITAEDWELWLRIHTVHDFHEYPMSTFAIRQHTGRSLSTIPASKILERDSYFADLIDHQLPLAKKVGRKAVNLFRADRYTFIALALVTENRKKLAKSFLFRSLKTSRYVVTRKRFWAIMLKLI